ncbi:MAG TPA: Y-family DNA polymerase [Pyrinomonadaceae bacterium]|nr:Y-family DNA polymerase [Pyrinomonadaceae bacterium]
MAQVFALCDCNNFYVSCERVFDAKLVGRAVVVLSNNDGCVISRSEEAKALGIRMGTPFYQIEHLATARGVRVLSSNYALYGDMSDRVMSVLRDLTPEVEIYSIDEAFMLLTQDVGRGSLTEFGREIQRTVYKLTGIPLSVGMAETKTLAKLANNLARKSLKAKGVLDLTRSPYQDCALERTPVEKVWGIGRRYTKTLKGLGVLTARQLRDLDVRHARAAFSVVVARVIEELRGNCCLPLESCPRPRKSLTCSRSFASPVETLSDLREAVAAFTVRVAEKLRRRKLAAGAVTVFVATSRFAGTGARYANSMTVEMSYPTDATPELLEQTRACAKRLYREGCKFKSAGVMLNALAPASPMTIRMQGDRQWVRTRQIMRAIDGVNARFGPDTIRYGLPKDDEPSWLSKSARRSPRYTTDWKELLVVA